ncbi:hypothetical protein BH11MYX1_BH11MYX1_38080 [soil metagenome]
MLGVMRFLLVCHLLLCSTGCFRTLPREPVASTDAGGGWSRIDQPGWIACEMPSHPSFDVRAIAATWGAFDAKHAVTMDGGTRYELMYAAVPNLPNAEAVFAETRANRVHGRGVTIRAERRFEVAGAPALELELSLAPGSEFNGTTAEVISRSWVIVESTRYFQIAATGSAGALRPQDVQRFFGSAAVPRPLAAKSHAQS